MAQFVYKGSHDPVTLKLIYDIHAASKWSHLRIIPSTKSTEVWDAVVVDEQGKPVIYYEMKLREITSIQFSEDKIDASKVEHLTGLTKNGAKAIVVNLFKDSIARAFLVASNGKTKSYIREEVSLNNKTTAIHGVRSNKIKKNMALLHKKYAYVFRYEYDKLFKVRDPQLLAA